MIRKLKTTLILISLVSGVAFLVAPALGGTVSALDPADCPYGTTTQTTTYSNGTKKTVTVCASASSCKNANGCLRQSDLVHKLQDIVNALAAGVGVVVTGTIIVGGVQYIVGGDNQAQVEASKKRITNGVIALVAFFLTYAFLQWLIPGGIL